ncbi:DUF4386 domain-containing protein [Paenibacillus tritici]|uniref:DUF4386 domain-containing protein n=1 Tax=Paenibacillus tritici TaxID=1873425 RepID=A0ABX2DP79_9BACL|nr:DUF4386 domain-containing protein [Paenibacillus tritici]NQX46468.1 DUF4386 domain-containing protein [Paenibacillus tritici]
MSATVARTGGISLIVMAIAAAFSYGYIHGSVVVNGDAAATFARLQSSPSLFRAEILGWIVIIACDVVAAWALYQVLRPVHPALSLLGAWLRLAYTAVLGVAVSSLIVVSLLTGGSAPELSGFTKGQLQGEVMLALQGFEAVWSAGLILFGGHLLVVGLLAVRAENIPKPLSVLLLLAGFGYMALHLCSLLVPEYTGFIQMVKWIFILPMTAGELGLGIWLLFRIPAPPAHAAAAS